MRIPGEGCASLLEVEAARDFAFETGALDSTERKRSGEVAGGSDGSETTKFLAEERARLSLETRAEAMVEVDLEDVVFLAGVVRAGADWGGGFGERKEERRERG